MAPETELAFVEHITLGCGRSGSFPAHTMRMRAVSRANDRQRRQRLHQLLRQQTTIIHPRSAQGLSRYRRVERLLVRVISRLHRLQQQRHPVPLPQQIPHKD